MDAMVTKWSNVDLEGAPMKSKASKKMDGKQNEGTTDNPFGPWMLLAYK